MHKLVLNFFNSVILSFLFLSIISFAEDQGPQKVQPEYAVPVVTQNLALAQYIYTLEDLKILYQEKSYQEFFKHVLDPRPALRGAQWKEMVVNLALDYQNNLLKTQLVSVQNIKFLDDLLEIPALREDEFFQKNRSKIGSIYFKNCHHQNCTQEMLSFWRKWPKDVEMALSFGNLVIEKKWDTDPWIFFKLATQGPLSEFYCKNPNLQTILIEKLSLLVGKGLSSTALKKEILEITSPDCWPALDKIIHPLLYSGQQTQREFAYRLLSTQDKLSTDDRDYFSLTYFLDDPGQGETFNQAWKALEEMGANHKRRQKALTKILLLDPLPDQVFSNTADEHRQIVLIKHLAKNIPEYMDKYAQACLHFLQGQGKFENGNPTVHCLDLISLISKQKQKPSWIDPQIVAKVEKKLNAFRK